MASRDELQTGDKRRRSDETPSKLHVPCDGTLRNVRERADITTAACPATVADSATATDPATDAS